MRGRIIRDGSCCGRLGRRRNESLFRPILLLIPPVYDNCLDGWMDGWMGRMRLAKCGIGIC